MHRTGRLLAAVLTGCVALLCACGALPSGEPGTAAVRAAVGSDGVARVRFDHRAGQDRDGRPGPTPVVTVPAATTVELVVGSDTAERVLIPELDQVRYVSAGGTVTVRFVPPGTGAVTVVLGSGARVGTIEVAQA